MGINFGAASPIWIEDPPVAIVFPFPADAPTDRVNPRGVWARSQGQTGTWTPPDPGAKVQILDEIADLIADAIFEDLSREFGELRLLPRGELTVNAKAKG